MSGVGAQARIYMVGYGRCNHAGVGDSSVLNAVINETVPMDRELRPTKNDVDGNSKFYGFEVMYSGSHSMSNPQYAAVIRASAIICKLHGWSARSIIGHREWTNTKPDPGYCPMDKFRRDVQAILDENTPPPPPQPQEEDDLPYTQEQFKQMVRDAAPHSGFFLVRKKDSPDGAVWLSNLISRRWVVSSTDLDSIRHWFDNWNIDEKDVYDVEDLSLFGAVVGDLPPSGALGTDPLPTTT
jgi:hypothetical protein